MLSRLVASRVKPASMAVFASRVKLQTVALGQSCLVKHLHTTPPRQRDFIESVVESFNKINPIARDTLDQASKFNDSPSNMKYFLLAGGLPFIIFPASMLLSMTYVPSTAFAQVAYGAAILSFLGGERFGHAITHQKETPVDFNTICHVTVPPAVAVMSLLCTPGWGLMSVLGGHLFAVWSDHTLRGYPDWFASLRAMGSIIAICGLSLTLVLAVLLPTDKRQSAKH